MDLEIFTEATTLWKAQKLDEAEVKCRDALAIYPTCVPLLMRLGSILDDQNENNEAEQMYRSALLIDPNHPGTLCNLGCLLMEKCSQQAEAESLYYKALVTDPNHINTMYNLANLLFYGKEQLIEAEKLYKRVLELEPDDLDTLCALGSIREFEGKMAESKTYYEKALAIDPEDIHTLCNLAQLLGDEDIAQSVVMYKRAIKLALNQTKNPKDASPLIGLANLYFYRTGNVRDAEKLYREALVIDSKNVHVRLLLGQLFEHTQRNAEAEAEYRLAAEQSPKDLEPRRMLAYLLTEKLGRHEEAETLIQVVLDKHRHDECGLEILGMTLENRKQFFQAAKTYKHMAVVCKRPKDDVKPITHYTRAAKRAIHTKFVGGSRTQKALELLAAYREKRHNYAGAADVLLRLIHISADSDEGVIVKAQAGYMQMVHIARNCCWTVKTHQLNHPDVKQTVHTVLLVAQRLSTHQHTLLHEMWIAVLNCLCARDYIKFGSTIML